MGPDWRSSWKRCGKDGAWSQALLGEPVATGGGETPALKLGAHDFLIDGDKLLVGQVDQLGANFGLGNRGKADEPGGAVD